MIHLVGGVIFDRKLFIKAMKNHCNYNLTFELSSEIKVKRQKAMAGGNLPRQFKHFLDFMTNQKTRSRTKHCHECMEGSYRSVGFY